MFSRNSASSRAIPFEKMLKMVTEEPFIPIAWQKDHTGMQGTDYFNRKESTLHMLNWLAASEDATITAKKFAEKGVTKQLVNRLLEPFMWHTVIITATEYENFFHLRCPQYELKGDGSIAGIYRSRKDYVAALNRTCREAGEEDAFSVDDMSEVEWLKLNKGGAEIHAARLAECMWDARNESTPEELKAGEWHIPFGDRITLDVNRWSFLGTPEELVGKDFTEYAIKIATARCARVSYNNFEGKDDYEADIKLYDRLSSSGHWSPFEHCAQAMSSGELDDNITISGGKATIGTSGNFVGFKQLRKSFDNENVIGL
jgi:hypothetical protein